MKEYKIENGEVAIKQLEVGPMDKASYVVAHQGFVIPCHDVFIQYEKGTLLIKRLNFPAKDILWPLGGRIKRGVLIEDSLREKVRDEAGLELTNLAELGCARTFFKTDPFGHGRGTDSINFVYFGRGAGQLRLDSSHEEPTIILPNEYKSIRGELHPYVRDFMDLSVQLVTR